MSQEFKIIAVGLSGGVDSSVALHLLQKQGYKLAGCSHAICRNSAICSDEALARAEQICKKMHIPYVKVDMYNSFENRVILDFVHEYELGHTPNPCVRCNERIRFTEFYQQVKTELLKRNSLAHDEQLGFATGHYVQKDELFGFPVIKEGKDSRKDQSYMLYRISPEILPNLRFPLGSYTKSEVAAIAAAHDFPTSSVKESQDICFIQGKYTDFLKKYIPEEEIEKPGYIKDIAGTVLGTHKGYMHYTIGQRQGLGLSNGPWYVSKLDAEENTIFVERVGEYRKKKFSIGEGNFFIPLDLLINEQKKLNMTVKVRYNTSKVPCRIEINNKNYRKQMQEQMQAEITIYTDSPVTVTPGQSAVLYHDSLVLGGGIILAS
ncbi:MAG: tRNA 2-thiouridine(34) synthase MnmA [Spirochaetia bacterium]|nr:tRNA 2-thiouridine(34) synthase MnmA [Spirochaetia bacterium]MCF7946388.1 tRNA 2-thiouridine(34) synthase MnmA [Spirochaetia bacterium]